MNLRDEFIYCGKFRRSPGGQIANILQKEAKQFLRARYWELNLPRKNIADVILSLLYLQFELISHGQTGMVALQSPGQDEALVIRGVATQQIFQLTEALWSYKQEQRPQMMDGTDMNSFCLFVCRYQQTCREAQI